MLKDCCFHLSSLKLAYLRVGFIGGGEVSDADDVDDDHFSFLGCEG